MEYDASFVTEVVLLLSWALAAWYVYFTFKESGHAKAKTIALTLVVLAWSIFAFGAVKYDFDRELFFGLPIRPLVYLLLAAALGYGFRWALVGKGLSQRMLIGMQLIRPIGMVFVLEHLRGNLPAVFAYPAGLGDLLVGLVALAVLIRYRNQEIPNGAVMLVIAVGIVDWVSAFFFGFTSSSGSPFQLFAFDQTSKLLFYPTGLIPLFLVPWGFIFHILSLTEMQRANRQARASRVEIGG